MTISEDRTNSTPADVAAFAINAVWYLSWAAAALAIVGTAFVAIVPGVREALVNRGIIVGKAIFTLPLEVRYHSAERRSSPGTPGSDAVQLAGHDDVVLARPYVKADIVVALANQILAAGIFLWLLQQLRALLRAVKRGHPFDSQNPRRIRRIAWLVIAIGPLRDALQFLNVAGQIASVSALVKQAQPGASVGYHVRFSWELVVIGLVILAIAHAFDAGVRLQHEQDLTV